MSKSIWKKETPKEEGWYWIRYRNGNSMVYSLANLSILNYKSMRGNILRSFSGGHWIEGPNHGGAGLKRHDLERRPKIDTSLRFGPKIPEAEDLAKLLK
jgi:hypothetical protein